MLRWPLFLAFSTSTSAFAPIFPTRSNFDHVLFTSLTDLIRELDERDVQYPVTATCADLEALLSEARQVEGRSATPVEDDISPTSSRTPQPSGKRKPLVQRVVRKSRVSVGGVAQRAARKAVRNVKSAARYVNEWVDVGDDDEEVIRTVPYSYVKRTIDVQAVPVESEATSSQTRRIRRPRYDPSVYDSKKWSEYASTERNPRQTRQPRPPRTTAVHSNDGDRINRGSQPRVRKEASFASEATPVDSNNTFILPPYDEDDEFVEQEPRNRERHESKERKIYSPFPNTEEDMLDRLGSFLGDATEELLWGTDDDVGEVHSNTTQDTKTSFQGKSRSKHWKDRMEERFDRLLGIHNINDDDPTFYQRWQRLEDAENERVGSSGRWRNTAVKYDSNKPIWQQASLSTLFTGRTPDGDSLDAIDEWDRRQNGSLLRVLSISSKVVLLAASYLCRWTSVRGALPQPIVAFSIGTALVSSRKRLRALVVTVLVLRAIGEFMQGSVYDREEDVNDDMS